MGDFNVCHQCHQNDKGRLVSCQTCHMKRYCIPCLYSWYSLPSLPSLYFAQKCPFCRNICSCTACLILRPKMNPHINLHFSDYIPHLDPSSISTSSSSVVRRTRTEPTNEEESERMTAVSQLYKLCGVRHWKPPVYECSDDEGPSHMRLFAVKVTVEIKADSRITVLECFGDPHHMKNIAAERAAVSALWYVKNVGHT